MGFNPPPSQDPTMSTVIVRPATVPNPVARRILVAGAVVALLDISYAYVFFGLILKLVGVQSLFQSISAGLLGRAAFQGGMPTALLGAGFHLLIAYSWTVAFYLAVRNFDALHRAARTTGGRIALGLAYGVVVYLLMDLVVLKLSRAHSTPPTDWKFYVNLVQHMVMIGLPIARIIGDGDVG
jgi:hypothetical protein